MYSSRGAALYLQVLDVSLFALVLRTRKDPPPRSDAGPVLAQSKIGVRPFATDGGESHENVVARNWLEFSISKSGDYNLVPKNSTRRCSQF